VDGALKLVVLLIWLVAIFDSESLARLYSVGVSRLKHQTKRHSSRSSHDERRTPEIP